MLNVSISYVLKLHSLMLAIHLINAIIFNTLSELLVKYTYTLNIKSQITRSINAASVKNYLYQNSPHRLSDVT